MLPPIFEGFHSFGFYQQVPGHANPKLANVLFLGNQLSSINWEEFRIVNLPVPDFGFSSRGSISMCKVGEGCFGTQPSFKNSYSK